MTLVQPDPSDHILMHICIIEPLLTFFNNSTFGRGAVGQSCQTTRWWGSVVISCSIERLFSKFLLWLWSMTSDQFHPFCAQYAIHMYAIDLTAIIWPQFCQRRRQIVLLAILLLIIQISSSSQCWRFPSSKLFCIAITSLSKLSVLAKVIFPALNILGILPMQNFHIWCEGKLKSFIVPASLLLTDRPEFRRLD